MNEVFVVESDRGRLVLRGHRHTEVKAVEFEHQVMDTARSGDVPAPRAVKTSAGDRIAHWNGRWWSLLVWIDGEQPDRGSHTVEQAASMGQMLARIHIALERLQPLSADAPPVEDTSQTIRTLDELVSFVQRVPNRGEDEVAAIRWLTGQRTWLASCRTKPPSEPATRQMVHGDYHDQNLVFNGAGVVGVLDWEKAGTGDPLEEMVRAMHLSFRLEPARCSAFTSGYRALRAVSTADLDRAAGKYGYRRDRSVWFFDELYRQGNERLRPLINRGPFEPFATSWDAVRGHL